MGSAGVKSKPQVISLNPRRHPDEKEAQRVTATWPWTRQAESLRFKPNGLLQSTQYGCWRDTERKHEGRAVSKRENNVSWV